MKIEEEMKNNLSQYIGEYESFIDATPYIYEELSKLLQKCNNKIDELKICKALAFAVSPNVEMGDEYGPYKYCPHIIVGGLILLQLNIETIDVFDIHTCVSKAMEIMKEEELKQLFEFVSIF